jgi:predicted ATPase
MLALTRLDRDDRTTLLAQITGGKALPSEIIDQIVDRTDGVPLFVEELTKSVLESGLLREERHRYILDRALPPFAIPSSLHASLLSRLDRLASVRLVAQIGAAIGREFPYTLLRAVSRLPEDELQAALALSPPSWSSREASRLTGSTASSTLWCRTRLTAVCCAALDSSRTRRLRKRPRPILQKRW